MSHQSEKPLGREVLYQFTKKIEENLGIFFAEKNWDGLEKKMEAAAKEFGFRDAKDCIRGLAALPLSTEHITLLAKHLTVGETYFFRDDILFQKLKETILPNLIEKRRDQGRYIRIWSSACCTGEEPYSIAILLHQLIPDMTTWKIHILGSDVNPNFLHKAEKGIFKKWSFRTTPADIQKNYFEADRNGFYHIHPNIKEMVKFIELNLIEDIYPSDQNQTQQMDIILCNNVLIYFSVDKINTTITKLTASLQDNGILLVSPTEIPYIKNDHLSTEQIRGLTVFRKELHPIQSKPQPQKSYHPQKKQPPWPKEAPAPPKQKSLHIENKEIKFQELYEQGQYDIITSQIKKMSPDEIKKCPPKQLAMAAKSFANQGDIENARVLIERVLQLEKLDPELHFFYGTLLQEGGNLPEAIKAYKKALFLDQNFVLGYYALGNALMTLGNQEEALRNLRNALHLFEKDPELQMYETKGISASFLKKIITSLQKTISCNK